MGLHDDGALLVRPDGHILCVAKSFVETVAQSINEYVKPVIAVSIERVA
jgi:hypothetical protein